MNFNKAVTLISSLVLATVLTACAGSNESAKQAASSPTPSSPSEIYEVHAEGRINVFYDRKLYSEFSQLGETSYRLTRIGAGPNGETLVFGLTKKDKKKTSGIPTIDLYDGKISAPDDFYGEMHRHGRIYVFSRFEDMKTVRDFGHPNYMYTQVGAGPKGETVVFVLNKSNKKKRPDALMDKFKQVNS